MGFKSDFYIGECEGMETKEHKLTHIYVLIMQVERFWGSFLCLRDGDSSYSLIWSQGQRQCTQNSLHSIAISGGEKFRKNSFKIVTIITKEHKTIYKPIT